MSNSEPILTSSRVFLPADPSSSSSSSTNEQHIHVYFITGNPGCIGYYHAFLTTLQWALRSDSEVLSSLESPGQVDGLASLRERAQQFRWTFHGRSLGGMVAREPVRSLQQQIALVEGDLLECISKTSNFQGAKTGTGKENVKVVLMGHSVGAYIGMEVLRRIRTRARQAAGEDLGLEIIGLVGLFPTITDIALSPRGVIASPLLNYALPVISSLANGLLWPWSKRYLAPIVQLVTGMDDDPTAVTTEFLLSPCGVRQALSMARDEMREITSDKWDEDIWGSGKPSGNGHRPARLAFLFGENDHWVKDAIRDDLIKARGRSDGEEEEWKADMRVDRSGIPHAFCLRHNLQTAKLVVPLLLRLVEKHSSSK